MSKVRKAPLPKDLGLWQFVRQGDFLDGYGVQTALNARDAARIAMTLPGWASGLLWLRNRLVAPFGLKGTPVRDDTIGPFPVVSETPNEVIVGFDDRHLNFRIAVHRQDDQVYGATWVHCNNGFGRFYLAAIMPFHILIMRNAMRRVAKAG